MTVQHYDLIIVGGGLTGLALARALRDTPLRILLVDSQPAPVAQAPHFDDRALALSEVSRQLLDTLGIWSAIAHDANPIGHIHVSDQGQFGRCALDAAELGFAAFGQVIELRVLGQALWQAISHQPRLTHVSHCNVTALSQQVDGVELVLAQSGQTQTVKGGVVLAADGGPSSLRVLAGLPAERFDYRQSALIANIETSEPHHGRAFERFTETGPLALLPLTRNRLSLVWTLSPSDAQAMQALPEPALIAKLQKAFGWRLGAIRRIGERTVFPLARIRSPLRRQGRLLLMGNAATMLHPIAGQGFNLALRDLMAFADWLQQQLKECADWQQPAALQNFIDGRLADSLHVQDITHGLVQLFSNRHPLLTSTRALSLSLLDSFPRLKHFTAVQAMGFR